MTQYKGIVTATLKHKNKIVARKVCHNGAKAALQIAFAKMLANYSTTEYLPYYMSGSYVDGESAIQTLGKVKLTGRNYQYKNGRYSTVCNAFFPVDTTDNVLNGLSLTLLAQDRGDEEVELASVKFPKEDIDSYDIQSGLQLNIRWEMYLAIDEVINNG